MDPPAESVFVMQLFLSFVSEALVADDHRSLQFIWVALFPLKSVQQPHFISAVIRQRIHYMASMSFNSMFYLTCCQWKNI